MKQRRRRGNGYVRAAAKATRHAMASETFWMDVQPLHAFDIPGDNTSEEVCTFLRRFGFAFYDGRSLQRCADPPWSLLAIRPDGPAGR